MTMYFVTNVDCAKRFLLRHNHGTAVKALLDDRVQIDIEEGKSFDMIVIGRKWVKGILYVELGVAANASIRTIQDLERYLKAQGL